MSAVEVARSCQACDMAEAVTVRGVCRAAFTTETHHKTRRVCPTHLAVYETKGALCSECDDRGVRSDVRYEVLEVQS